MKKQQNECGQSVSMTIQTKSYPADQNTQKHETNHFGSSCSNPNECNQLEKQGDSISYELMGQSNQKVVKSDEQELKDSL